MLKIQKVEIFTKRLKTSYSHYKKAWGTSKKAYYNADEASDIEEMREEEEEALRIQKEQLAHMDEEDFVDDTLPGWGLGAANDTEADKKLVEGVTKDLEDISFR